MDHGLTDPTALSRALFGTDDTELMTVDQLLNYKALQAALLQAKREGYEDVIHRIATQEMIDTVPAVKPEEKRLYEKLLTLMKWCHQRAKESGT